MKSPLAVVVLAAAAVVGLVAIAALLFAVVSLHDEDEEVQSRGDGVLLSIGDSIAAGNGSSDPATASFVAIVAADQGLTLENLAVAGATTAIVIDEQLDAAVSAIAESDVRAVLLSAGGNDLAALIPNAACVDDPLPSTCPLDEALRGVGDNVRSIVGRIRRVDADVPVVLLAYPNFFSGTGHAFDAPAGRVLPRYGEMLDALAAEFDGVAVAHPDFDGRGGELTHVLDAQFDPHPNDAGHRLIAEAVIAALARGAR